MRTKTRGFSPHGTGREGWSLDGVWKVLERIPVRARSDFGRDGFG